MTKTATRRRRHEKAAAFNKRPDNEPLVREESYRADILEALNWYNAYCEEKETRKYAEEYIKKNGMKDFLYSVQKASFHEIRQLGVIGRLILREQYIPFEVLEKILLELEEVKKKYPKPDPKVAKVVSIQDRLLESARTIAGEIEDQIDIFVTAKKNDFDPKKFLEVNSVSGPVAKKIGDMFKPLAKELLDAVQGKDEDLVEGYSNFSSRQLKKFQQFVQDIVDACTQKAVSVVRAPRARKPKPPSKVVGKLKYMKEFPDLKLKSVDPTKIIGADELWAYNPQKRQLIVFRAEMTGLSVKGSSIINYDILKSEMKTVRKPDEFFKGWANPGKRAMNNSWKDLKGLARKPKSRINDQIILLAVY